MLNAKLVYPPVFFLCLRTACEDSQSPIRAHTLARAHINTGRIHNHNHKHIALRRASTTDRQQTDTTEKQKVFNMQVRASPTTDCYICCLPTPRSHVVSRFCTGHFCRIVVAVGCRRRQRLPRIPEPGIQSRHLGPRLSTQPRWIIQEQVCKMNFFINTARRIFLSALVSWRLYAHLSISRRA